MSELPRVEGVEFAPIPNREGYAVGDDGSVWSCWIERHACRGEAWRRLATRLDRKGYERVTLGQRKNRTSVPVHTLVLRAFHGEPPPGCEACHGNDNRADNRRSNLRWDTHAANVGDSIAAGTFVVRVGELNGRAKLTEADVVEVHRLRRSGVSQSEVARRFGVTKTAVRLAEQGKTWPHLHPDFPTYIISLSVAASALQPS